MGYGRAFAPPILLWLIFFHHRYSWLQHTSSHTFPVSPNHIGTSRIHPFRVGKQNLHTEDTEPEILVCSEAYQGNAIYNHNVWEGTPLKCFSFLLKIPMTKCFAVLDLLIFIKVKLNFAGQAEASGEKSVPTIPPSVLVHNSYVAHLFLLFQNKLKLTCNFFNKFLQLSLLGLLSNYFFISFLHACTAQAKPICDFPP